VVGNGFLLIIPPSDVQDVKLHTGKGLKLIVRITTMANNDYLEKLKDPRWQRKRLEIFNRDEFACQICYSVENTLVVHHKVYLANKEPWEYDDYMLTTLCEECHDAETKMRPVYNKYLLGRLAPLFFHDSILDLTVGFNKLELLHSQEIVAGAYSLALSEPTIQRELIDKFFKYCKRDAKLKRKHEQKVGNNGKI
jgi:hypothetical protein